MTGGKVWPLAQIDSCWVVTYGNFASLVPWPLLNFELQSNWLVLSYLQCMESGTQWQNWKKPCTTAYAPWTITMPTSIIRAQELCNECQYIWFYHRTMVVDSSDVSGTETWTFIYLLIFQYSRKHYRSFCNWFVFCFQLDQHVCSRFYKILPQKGFLITSHVSNSIAPTVLNYFHQNITVNAIPVHLISLQYH